MANEKKDKTYKIRFESMLPEREFIVKGTKLKRMKDGSTIKEQVVPRFAIKSKQTKKIDQKTYDYMIKRHLLLTPEEKEEQDVIRRKYGETPRNRSQGPDGKPPVMTDKEKKTLITDKPYLIEDTEE